MLYPVLEKALRKSELTALRRKVVGGKASIQEMLSLFKHLEVLEKRLDKLEADGFFGYQSWRGVIGLPEDN